MTRVLIKSIRTLRAFKFDKQKITWNFCFVLFYDRNNILCARRTQDHLSWPPAKRSDNDRTRLSSNELGDYGTVCRFEIH